MLCCVKEFIKELIVSKMRYAICGTMAFPAALMLSFLHFEKVIPSNSAESPSFREQTGD